MPLTIQIQQNFGPPNPGLVVVKLAGSLDTATAPDLESRLTGVFAGIVKDLAFDLAELKFVSSAGLRVFAVARKQLLERGGHLTFVNMQPQIKDVFEIVASLRGLSVFANLAEFDEYLAARQKMHQSGQ